MRTVIAALFVLHGLIHLLGFVKAFKLANDNQLAENVSPTWGLLWLLAAIFSITAAIAMLTHAETVTMFNDLCALARGALLSPDITWDAIDDHRVTALFVLGVNTVTAELRFDDSGDLVDFIADGRGATSPDGRTITPLRWSTPLRDYRQVGPARVATRADVTWHPDAGAWTYGEFRLTCRAYDVAHRSRPTGRHAGGISRAPVRR